MAPLSDDAEVEGAAQPADDGVNGGNAIATASVNANDYTEIKGDVTSAFTNDGAFTNGGSYRLTGDAWSTAPITITKDTTIDLAGYKLYYRTGKNDTFITVTSGALTIEDSAKPDDKPFPVSDKNTGRPAKMAWDGNSNATLTYYVTTSKPKADGPGTTETTTQHVVSGFGAIVAASKDGSVQQVISVEGGGTLNLSGGMVTTPHTLVGDNGHVIFSRGAVNISGGYVTNGNGGGWGGGLCMAAGSLNMTGGVIAANKAAAGGGIFADRGVTVNLSGGVISGNATYDNGIGKCGDDTGSGGYGGGVYTKGADVTIGGSANITNNRVDAHVADPNEYNYGLLGGGGIACTHGGTLTMTDGSVTANYSREAGGGIFIQKNGRLNILKSLITDNKAGGWSGGIGACPTGETIVSHSKGAAIYGNEDNVDQYGNKLSTYHYSAGGDNKNEDHDEKNYVTPTFQDSGHKDFFLVRNKDNVTSTIAVVLGKMLGGGSAGWHGTCDGNPVTIDPNGGAEAKWMFGLAANPSPDAIKKALDEASTIISGNYSYTHGGGIMTNGDLIVGEVTKLDVYPAIKVKANKVLMKDGKTQNLSGHGYRFKLLGKADGSGGEPYWNTNGTLNANGCDATPEVTVNDEGEIVIDTAANFQSGNYDLYLAEVPIAEKGTTFDKTIYKIHVSVSATPTKTSLMGIDINRYAVDKSASKVFVKKKDAPAFTNYDGFYSWTEDSADSAVSIVTIGNDSSPAFKNELAPYQASGTWTPQVTKKVNGGEMKKFNFELYTMDGSEKTVLDTKSTVDDSKNSQTVTFVEQKIGPLKVSDFNDGKATFTYYICECAADAGKGTSHKGYTNDTKTFKVVVTAKDNKNGTLTCTPAYYEVDANGQESASPTGNPTFTNTYSTSLPLSGMSGVTLTYLAGAAVLCAAAAWMHIRRKANAKGGKRRE